MLATLLVVVAGAGVVGVVVGGGGLDVLWSESSILGKAHEPILANVFNVSGALAVGAAGCVVVPILLNVSLGSAAKATTSHKGKKVVMGTAIARPSVGGVNVYGVEIYCQDPLFVVLSFKGGLERGSLACGPVDEVAEELGIIGWL
jgi:hypothetical protein